MDMKVVEALFENVKRLAKENVELRARVNELKSELDDVYGV